MASDDGTVRVWDPTTGIVRHTLEGHTSGVLLVCALPGSEGTTLLASGSNDRTVRVWDPTTGRHRYTINTPYPAQALASTAPGHLTAGLAAGILTLALQ